MPARLIGRCFVAGLIDICTWRKCRLGLAKRDRGETYLSVYLIRGTLHYELDCVDNWRYP